MQARPLLEGRHSSPCEAARSIRMTITDPPLPAWLYHAGGTITTIITPDEVPALTAMMAKLGLTPMEQDDAAAGPPLLQPGGEASLLVLEGDEPGEAAGQGAEAAEGGEGKGLDSGQVDKLRKGLEDIFNLM